ncbi:MAG TPA: hypothetical protein DEA22_04500 [Blastocatellia bacterium]|nr:hypothetical protein [Blastocatellia bacterium]
MPVIATCPEILPIINVNDRTTTIQIIELFADDTNIELNVPEKGYGRYDNNLRRIGWVLLFRFVLLTPRPTVNRSRHRKTGKLEITGIT